MIERSGVHTFVMICALSLVMVSYSSCRGNRSAKSGETTAQLAANLPPLTLQQMSSLDQKTFEHSLPQLREAMERTSPQPGADRETVTAIAAKLRQTGESAPDYWPTALRFITFASSQMAPDAPPPGQKPRGLSDVLSVGLMRGIREKNITMLFDEGDLGNGEFTNCRIIFTLNPVRLTHVQFSHCAFELPTADPPSPYIKALCRILLSSNLESIAIASL